MRLSFSAAVLLLAGCGPSWDEFDARHSLSPIDFCHWRERQGREPSRKCIAIEQAAGEEKRGESDRQDRDEATLLAASRAVQAKLAEIRASPKYPEIGATTAEAKTICTTERGEWVDQDAKVGCKVGGVVVFACSVDDDATMNRCTRWLEGAELAETRRGLVEGHGQPEPQEVANGYRVFSWSDGTVLTGYARGVMVTESKAPDATAKPPTP